MGGLIYENGVLQSISHDEGRIKTENGLLSQPKYQFFITDHLGNTRAIVERIDESTALVQETHYYPFGAVMEGVGLTGDWKFLYQGKENISFNGTNLYDFNSRSYDAYLGRFLQLDGANQFASGYIGMGNMPTIGIDPDGQWVHIAIGAVVGGVFNLGVKAFQGKINSWGDGFAAFGIGAAAGAVTAATGGAAAVYTSTGSLAGAFSYTAVTASSTGLIGGAIAGATGSATGGLIQGVGNAAYFGDPYSAKDWALGVGIGTLTGGLAGGISAKLQNKSILNGTSDKRLGTAPDFNKVKWVKTNQGWKLSRTSWGDLSWQFPDITTPSGSIVTGGKYNYSPNSASSSDFALLNSGIIHRHHVLPQSFRPWFNSRGISNIDDYTVRISESTHLRGVHGRGVGNLPGRWNQNWADFIRSNPNATPSQIFHHAENLLKRYGLDHLPYVPYR